MYKSVTVSLYFLCDFKTAAVGQQQQISSVSCSVANCDVLVGVMLSLDVRKFCYNVTLVIIMPFGIFAVIW